MIARAGLFAVLVVSAVLAGCSSYTYHRHHGHQGMGDSSWEKADKEVEELVARAIKDPAKAQGVTEVMGEMIQEIKTSREQSRAFHRRLYELNADYDAAPEQFTKVLDELNTRRMMAAAKILGLRFKMKNLLTVEEWKALSDEMKAYGSRYYGQEPHSTKQDGA